MRGRGPRATQRLDGEKRRQQTGVVEIPGAAVVEILVPTTASRQRSYRSGPRGDAEPARRRARPRTLAPFGSVAFRAPRSPRASFAAARRGPPTLPAFSVPPHPTSEPDKTRSRWPPPPSPPLLRARLPRALGPRRGRAPLARATPAPTRRRPLRVCRFLPRRGDRPRGARRGRDGAPMQADPRRRRPGPRRTHHDEPRGRPSAPRRRIQRPLRPPPRVRQQLPRVPTSLPSPSPSAPRRGRSTSDGGFTDAGDAGIGDYSPEAKTRPPLRLLETGDWQAHHPRGCFRAARRRSISPPRIPIA